jgi:hypothetical protein
MLQQPPPNAVRSLSIVNAALYAMVNHEKKFKGKASASSLRTLNKGL